MDYYKEKLSELFNNSHISDQQINETIDLVLQETNTLSPEEKLEEMINFLIESGDSTLAVHNEEGAIGFDENPRNTQFNQCFDRILNVFPDICPNYLIEFCQKYDQFDFDTILNDLSNIDYVKMDKDPIDLWEHLKQVLPDADPIYLRNHARVLVNRPEGEIQQFLENAIDNHDYPSMQDYLINKKLTEDLAVYITKFSVDKYLKNVPNPIETFLNPQRKSVLNDNVNESDLEFALNFLYNQFTYHRKSEIKRVFWWYNKHLVKTCNKLKILPKAFRHPRKAIELKECTNVDLLKEISFLKHEKLIRQYIKQQDEKYRNALDEARMHGLLQTCSCCFEDELIPEECVFCNKGCVFCKDCVRTGAEHVIGREETVFPCLAACDSEFHYATLQMVLDEKIFQRVWQRKQIEEIRNANIDGLEQCLFCDFCMIPVEGDPIFECRNIACMKKTCRKCHHEAHIPLRCEEIEYDEDVQIRTQIEKEMTEALLRKCWKCSKQFYKESGCNKMTCVCGAKMCYICGQAVTDYAHFKNSGCPLYTENLQQFHLNRVRLAAESAKQKLGVDQNPTKLKFDPSRGIETDVH